MSEFSHRKKIKLMQNDRVGSSIKSHDDNSMNYSMISYNSGARSAIDTPSGHPSFISNGIHDKDDDSHLDNSFHVIGVAPSVKSLKSNMPPRSRSLNASKASLSSKRSNIQSEARDMQVHRKIKKPWYGVGKISFRIAVIFYIISLALLITGLTLIILTSFGNIFLPMDVAEFLGPAIVVVAVICFAVGIKMTYNAYKTSELSRRRLKLKVYDWKTVSMTAAIPESHTRYDKTSREVVGTIVDVINDKLQILINLISPNVYEKITDDNMIFWETIISGTQSNMAVSKKYTQI